MKKLFLILMGAIILSSCDTFELPPQDCNHYLVSVARAIEDVQKMQYSNEKKPTKTMIFNNLYGIDVVKHPGYIIVRAYAYNKKDANRRVIEFLNRKLFAEINHTTKSLIEIEKIIESEGLRYRGIIAKDFFLYNNHVTLSIQKGEIAMKVVMQD